MLNIKEITSLDEFEKSHAVGDDVCKIPLFHGTRRYALSVSAKERERFYSACKTVMEFAKNFACSNALDESVAENYRRESKNYRFLNTLVYLMGTKKFEYGDFYLTSSYSSAVSFAHNVGGELGDSAYAQCKGFCDLDIALDGETKAASDIVSAEYEKYQKSEKVVLAFFGVRFSDLTHEGGGPFLIPTDDAAAKSYLAMKIEDLHESIDDDDSQTNANFILSNVNEYMAHALSEKDLKRGFSLFTNITDVEGAIKSHNRYNQPKWEL